MEAFGFGDLVMEEAFGTAERVGPYVGDVALGERLLAEVGARRTPLFLFCVTMENHGPWKPGRLSGLDDPQAQYMHHVAHTGQMVEAVVAGLDRLAAGRGQTMTLCVFGDHAPSLPACTPGFGGRDDRLCAVPVRPAGGTPAPARHRGRRPGAGVARYDRDRACGQRRRTVIWSSLPARSVAVPCW